MEEDMRIVPMTYDKVFKGVLLSKEARGYLVSLISNITGIDKEKIKDNIVFKNNEQLLGNIKEKKKITDMLIEIKDNVINLEMNKEYYEGLLDRNNEYISKIRETLVKEGENYSDIPKIIQINFDNYNIYKPDKRVVIKFEMMDKECKIREGVNVESYHVILPNAKEKYYNNEKDALVKELMVMMAETSKELEKLIKENMELRPVGEKLKDLNDDSSLLLEYDYEEHQRRVRNSLMSTAIKKGWNEGKEEGIKEGIEKGIEKGKIEGALESKIDIAKNMLDKNFEINLISQITGLSIEEIKGIL